MVNLHRQLPASLQLFSRQTGASAPSSQRFAAEISQALSQKMHQLGISAGNAKVTLNPGSGRTTTSSTAATSSNPATTPSKLGFNALVPQDTVATSSSTTTNSPAASACSTTAPFQHWYADNAADDAYWSQQPAAVQELREIRDPGQRQVLAGKLAAQGYQIDNCIMVWGWDAGQVMAERKADGYTWVPAANQAAVSAAPGITGAGITPYDPTSPPSGSIAV